MLGKVLKYEFSATGRMFLPCYAVLIAMSGVARLFYTGGMDMDTPRVLITMLMVMLFTAVWVLTVIIIVRRFWTNLIGREGYLTNTLPAKPWQHVFSKMLVSEVWCIASLVASAIALLIMLGGDTVSFRGFGEFWSQLIQVLRDNQIGGQAILFGVEFIFMALFGCFAIILQVYASMAIGQLANKHRIWASLGAFFGINIIMSIISSYSVFNVSTHGIFYSIFNYDYSVQNYNAAVAAVNHAMFLSLIITIAVCAVFFFITSYILHKHLNLQ